MYDNIILYIDTFSADKIVAIALGIFVIFTKLVSCKYRRQNKLLVKEREGLTIANQTIDAKQESKPMEAITNLGVIIILSLCLIILVMVQYNYDRKLICFTEANKLLDYWNSLFFIILSAGYIFSDIKDISNNNFAKLDRPIFSINLFQYAISMLYIPICISLVAVCR